MAPVIHTIQIYLIIRKNGLWIFHNTSFSLRIYTCCMSISSDYAASNGKPTSCVFFLKTCWNENTWDGWKLDARELFSVICTPEILTFISTVFVFLNTEKICYKRFEIFLLCFKTFELFKPGMRHWQHLERDILLIDRQETTGKHYPFSWGRVTQCSTVMRGWDVEFWEFLLSCCISLCISFNPAKMSLLSAVL